MDSSEAYSPHVNSDEVLATLLANANEPSGVEFSPELHRLALGDSVLFCPSPLVGGEAKESGNGEVDEGFEGERAGHHTLLSAETLNGGNRYLCTLAHVYGPQFLYKQTTSARRSFQRRAHSSETVTQVLTRSRYLRHCLWILWRC